MAIKVRFDIANNPIPPRLILATRSGSRIRELPIEQVVFHDTMMNGSEFSFIVNKANCVDRNGDIDESFWRRITDLKLAYSPEFDMWYELSVEINERDDTVRTCEAKSLGEAELSQINVYGIEINTEDDIARDDYEPTVVYNPDNKDASLIDRLLEKAPHYRIAHVDDSIKDIQRTFQFDSKTIYDSFQEVEKEIDCIIIPECRKTADKKIDRTISIYDLETSCMVCGGRGDFEGVCPYCGSTAIKNGYGKDTAIYVDRDNLAEEITYSTDIGAVKNCFRLETGDDLMTATVMNCNPNGSQYIWYITDEMREDMSDALRARLQEYDEQFDYYQNEYSWTPSGNIVSDYNSIVNKYRSIKQDLETIVSPIVGYPALMDAYYNTIDLQLFLNDGLMPTPESSGHTVESEAAKLTSMALSPVAVANIDSCTESTASSAVLGMAKCIVSSDFQVKVATSAYDAQEHTWTGSFTVTSYGEEEESATSGTVSVLVTGDMETYIQQKLKRALKQRSDESNDIVNLFEKNTAAYTAALTNYSLQGLLSIRDACQAVLDILIQQGVADNTSWADAEHNLYETLYVPYLNKMSATESEIAVRTQELATVVGINDEAGMPLYYGLQMQIEQVRRSIHDAQNFEDFLGEELLTEFASYRREDSFSNTNFISDGLNNEELFDMARQFLDLAQKELKMSATLQHSIDAELHNLLAMREFHPLVDQFSVGNWIRLGVDKKIYRLRLSEYTVKYDDMALDVEFTDVRHGGSVATDIQSLLASAKSMSTTYGGVMRQAKRGDETAGVMKNWASEGFSLTTKLVGGADHQEFVIDELGVTGREYVPETDSYTDEQIRMISHGVYVTNDGWLTAKAGIGKFLYLDPRTGETKEGFGVIADKLVGNLILSKDIGVFSDKNAFELGNNGFILTTTNQNNETVFLIQRKTPGATAEDDRYESLMYVDDTGKLVLNGSASINASDGELISLLDTYEYAQDTRDMYKGDFAALQTSVQSQIDTSASAVNERFLLVEQSVADSAAAVESELADYIKVIDGQIRRGYIEDPDNPGEYIFGIAVSEGLKVIEGAEHEKEHDGEKFYELETQQSFGIYTATGWQFWADGQKIGWFSSVDGNLHTTRAVFGEEWMMSPENGFGLRRIGG